MEVEAEAKEGEGKRRKRKRRITDDCLLNYSSKSLQ